MSLACKKGRIDDPVYEHLAKCSPCYREFRGFQQSFGTEPRRFPLRYAGWLGAAAAVLLVASGAVWFSLQPGEQRLPPQQPAVPQSQVAQQRQMHVDLRKYVVTRSEEQTRDPGPVTLTRDRLDLTVLLPIGFEPGRYEVQILDASLRSQASAFGDAAIRDYITTLRTTIDLASLPPARYQIALRREGEDWRLFPVEVK